MHACAQSSDPEWWALLMCHKGPAACIRAPAAMQLAQPQPLAVREMPLTGLQTLACRLRRKSLSELHTQLVGTNRQQHVLDGTHVPGQARLLGKQHRSDR